MAVEEVLIDFKVNTDELETAQEQLAKAGKIDSAALEAFNKRLKASAGDTKALVAEFKKVAAFASLMGKEFEQEFAAGIQEALDEAGVSAEEFADALKQVEGAGKTMKQELREIKEQLSQMKLEGRDNTEEFIALRDRAGQLADAIADANSEINNMASDTRNIDNVVGSISALAGGFAAVQGAAALFGDENEDLQKALLKVNAAMAIAQGLQTVYNATQKEGAVTKLADVVATNAQIAVQKLYTIVTGKATAATTAFKVALATTGIGLVVVAVMALASAFDDTADSIDDVNKQIDILKAKMAGFGRSDARDLALYQAQLRARGATETEVAELTLAYRKKERDSARTLVAELKKVRDAQEEGSDAYNAANNEVIKAEQARLDAINEVAIAEEELKLARINDAKKAKEDSDKAAREARDRRRKELQDIVYFLERQLLGVRQGSAEELDIRRKLAIAKRDVELAQEGVTREQSKLIEAQAIKEREQLTKDYLKRISEIELQAESDRLAAALQNIQLSYAERLELSIEQLQVQAQIEINAAEENAEKIKLIEAKLARDITNLRNAELDRQLQLRVQAEERNAASVRRVQERIVADTKRSLKEREDALNKIFEASKRGLEAELEANLKREQSDEDYVNTRDRILSQLEAMQEEHNFRMNELYEQDAENRRAQTLSYVRDFIVYGQKAAEFVATLNQMATDRDNAAIEEQRQRLDQLLEAGAITEKEAARRAKEIEIMERQARQRQAQREKQEAMFKAVLSIPQAYLEGLTQGGPIVAAIYAALAATQAALIAARPIPKFFRGKRNNYEGPGIVGDMGAELVEHDGRLYLYTQPVQTYLKANDKVFTAAETRKMLHNDRAPVTMPAAQQRMEIDYDKLAKAIPQSTFSVNIDKDFIEESVANGLSRTRYYDKWYKF